MAHNLEKIDDAALALLAALTFEEGRAWKGHDFGVLNRLYEKGYIQDPMGKAKSVWLTPEGLRRGNEIADRLFGTSGAA